MQSLKLTQVILLFQLVISHNGGKNDKFNVLYTNLPKECSKVKMPLIGKLKSDQLPGKGFTLKMKLVPLCLQPKLKPLGAATHLEFPNEKIFYTESSIKSLFCHLEFLPSFLVCIC